MAIERQQGRIKFVFRAFSYSGSYKLCVKPPRHQRECREFRLARSPHSLFASKIDFARNYFHRARGRYAVSWHTGGFRIGKVLHFRHR